MITTVTLNAAIDKTYFVPGFEKNRLNRTEAMYTEPGGKGINVAKVLHTLDIPVIVSGIVGGYNGRHIISMLDDFKIAHQMVQAEGESRICLNIVDRQTAEQTEINEFGPEMGETVWQKVKDKIQDLASQSKFVVLSGSLPKGLPENSYAELIQRAKDTSARVIIDTSGSALKHALEAEPYMIKPNQDEFAGFLGQNDVSETEVIAALRDRHRFPVPITAVSLGSEGAIVSVEGELYKLVAPKISAVNPVGSGDAFTAGMVAGLSKGQPIEETLKMATAAGTANALESKGGAVDLKRLESIKSKVKVNRMS